MSFQKKFKYILFVSLIGLLALASILYFFGWFKSIEHEKNLISPSATLEQAVHNASLIRSQGYYLGEFAVEGHVILGSEIDENTTTVYTVSSWSRFGFENGVFTMISAAARIPTVITFSKNDKGEYILQNYQQPLDGSANGESLKKLFPSKYHSDISHKDKFNDDLVKQQEIQASEYLKSIGRTASVTASYVEKDLLKIDVEASNKLLEIIPDNFPYWLGTVERLESGIRYIYETAQSKTADGYDLIIFTKKKLDGKVVETYRYKIVGQEVILE